MRIKMKIIHFKAFFIQLSGNPNCSSMLSLCYRSPINQLFFEFLADKVGGKKELVNPRAKFHRIWEYLNCHNVGRLSFCWKSLEEAYIRFPASWLWGQLSLDGTSNNQTHARSLS